MNENVIKEVSKKIEYKGKEYKIVFNLNVMEQIQEEFGTLGKWGELTDNSNGEVNIKALIFGFTCMINEGIEIENENNGTNEPLLTKKQVGRMVTEIGTETMAQSMNQVVIDSVNNEEKNA